MKAKTSKATIWDALAGALADRPAERPADSVTAAEFAGRMNCSHCYAAARLRRMVANGKLAAVPFRTDAGKRGVCYVVAG